MNITWGGWTNYSLLQVDVQLPQDHILRRFYFLSPTGLGTPVQNQLTGLEKGLFLDAQFNSIDPSIYLYVEHGRTFLVVLTS